MQNPSKQSQKGAIRLHHVLLIVIAVVGLVLLFKKGLLPGMDQFPSMAQITNNLPSVNFKPAGTTSSSSADQNINASVASAEGELINDEWAPSAEDNEVYQEPSNSSDSDYPSTSLMTEEAKPEPKSATVIQETVQRKRVIHVTPTRVKNPPKEFPANLERGYYTVQTYAGYDSKVAYGIRRSLEEDGYLVYIYQIEDRVGVLFKVRVGRYANLNSARAVRDQVRRRYPKQLSRSFVMMHQTH
ncbi:MAG: hypothetical protein RLZZ422_749 [Pseudomonadota bacterium]|jgi:cell division septation protein DedD